MFDDLEVAHEHLSRFCSTQARLSRTLNLAQLMMVLRASTQPLIQINALEGFLDEPLAAWKADLPEDTNSRVRLTMIPNPKIGEMTKEKANSLTHLLTATFAYKLL